ncbi:MAG: phospho-sugar mutase [Puniceicoccales bacterium]|jgi:phosphoglucomutase|nr:phospho-sugar mutase [Puniceicoccales bacterium]
MTKILTLAAQARHAGKLLHAAYDNLAEWLQAGFLPEWALQSLEELAKQQAWGEINDRFFKKLAFGTGGMRGLTIGRITTQAELGVPGPQDTPAHPAVGANNLNDFTLVRATIGLFRYVDGWLTRHSVSSRTRKPRLVIAHDVRHFSRHFCELAAGAWTQLGGEAFIFDGPRSTPQLSFTVRHLHADTGIVITASHNPPSYNGFKCYFNDGAQVVPPHDSGIIAEVNAVRLSEIPSFSNKDLSSVQSVPVSAENAYLARIADNVLDKDIIARARPNIVYTNIHGTGDVMILPALARFNARVTTIPAQRSHDPRFPTVKSPNPENAEAFTLALETAKKENADIVIATDPDDDRVGAAVRELDGSYRLITGNTIGSALAAYRIAKMKATGIIPQEGSQRATLVKTFVTTPLQDAIAKAENIRCVNTLTGFKWIGAKLRKYQEEVENALRLRGAGSIDYDILPWSEHATLLQRHSTFFVFGGEESYGYLGTDSVRDKDGNAAALMIVELAAWLKEQGLTFSEYLDQIYLRCGFYTEDLLNIVMEGADGAARIRAILDSLRDSPPSSVDGAAVVSFLDFGRQDITDTDGDPVPKEDFFFFTLDDGRRFAVRGSGTEPKIKYYLFAGLPVKNAAALEERKALASRALASLRSKLKADAIYRSKK